MLRFEGDTVASGLCFTLCAMPLILNISGRHNVYCLAEGREFILMGFTLAFRLCFRYHEQSSNLLSSPVVSICAAYLVSLCTFLL